MPESKVALITGAGSGLGQAIARRLAEDGAQLVLLDRNPDGLAETAELLDSTAADASSQAVDVVDAEAVQAAVTAAVRDRGRVDWIVNSAGVGTMAPLLELTAEDWDEVLAINLKGTFLVCQAFIRHALERGGGGAIVNIGSIASRMGAEPLLHYCASKAGIVELGHGLARSYAPDRVRVNAVLPGYIRWTPRQTEGMREILSNAKVREHLERQFGGTVRMEGVAAEDVAAAVSKAVPLGTAPTAEDVAAAVAFLLGDQAKSITGQVIAVDGGVTMGW